MNVVVMMGRLTKDPEVRYTSKGEAVANYSIAVDRYKDEADFFRCVAFGKQAEFAEKYLHKGSRVAVCGRMQNNSYEKDGVKVRYDEVLIQRQEFADSKRDAKPDEGFMNVGEIDNLFNDV